LFRIHLSQANVGQREIDAVVSALSSGWVTPAGPDLDAFEREIGDTIGRDHVAGLASGTAALHLGLRAVGVQPGDDVILPTLTFAAPAFAVVHAGANPVFVDSEDDSWGMDANLLDDVLTQRTREGRRPAAVVPIDMLGRPADYDALTAVCNQHGIPMLMDAAESLGATYKGRPAGSAGVACILSFNGNKIVTTSGGGAFASDDARLVEKVRFWATQAREPQPWYEHQEIGHNYRLSNILAALGRAQLARLPDLVERRRHINGIYRDLLGDADGITVLEDPSWGESNSWLSCLTFDAAKPGTAERVRLALADRGIESRRVWKPMHQQPVFAAAPAYLNGVSDRAFDNGLCLPSGVGLEDDDIRQVAKAILEVL
jgi:dTDP-4-amino-4,6-dideoxygalactose transaminase